MAEDHVVEWPVDARHDRWRMRPHAGRWRPLPVLLNPIRDPWAHRLYARGDMTNMASILVRPRAGFLIIDSFDGRELGLIVRLQPDPIGREQSTWNANVIRDGYQDVPITDRLYEHRRWVGIRPDGSAMRGTATRDQAIRDVLRPVREWETLPVEPPAPWKSTASTG